MGQDSFRSLKQMTAIYDRLAKQGQEDQPYILEYKTENQELVFFGSVHSADTKHPQTALLDDKWEKFAGSRMSPKHVFSEGGLRPLDGKNKEQAIRSDAESGHVCWLAAQDDIPISSPEPDRKDEIDYLHGMGFSYEEIITYYFARQMLQWANYDHENQPNWREYARNIKLYGSVHDWGGLDLGLESLLRIYKRQTGDAFTTDKKALYPLSDPSQSPVSAASGRYRDEFLYGAIKRKWSEGYSLFVVYGSGHAIVLETALEAFVKGKND